MGKKFVRSIGVLVVMTAIGYLSQGSTSSQADAAFHKLQALAGDWQGKDDDGCNGDARHYKNTFLHTWIASEMNTLNNAALMLGGKFCAVIMAVLTFRNIGYGLNL